MNDAVLLLYLLNFAFIGALPVVFFQRGGSLSAMWWLTASPFFLRAGALVAAFVGPGRRFESCPNSSPTRPPCRSRPPR